MFETRVPLILGHKCMIFYIVLVLLAFVAERSSDQPVLSRHRGSVTGILPDPAESSALWTNKLLSCH